ncbi:hypothetical protein DPMN_061113 [Dreissena polymorpha]|uniref:Uncharacterized protein n=1 Tax=Dreissena polymorpha TaxID=45954 RepID=A0A9D4HGL2_DREPO|nr:hypothetical protein DPMN_061113 [Dreissena polymorpha]
MNWESPGITGNDRRGTENNWDSTGNHWICTVAPLGPITPPADERQRPGCCRWCPGECMPASRTTVALPGLHRDKP